MTKSDPWYIHGILYAVIVILVVLLIKVAIIDPTQVVESEKYFKNESRLRLKNLREAEILWEKKHGQFSGNLDSLITFIEQSPYVDSIRNAFDSLTNKSADPFLKLSNGQFTPDSLFTTPKSGQKYIVQVDSTTSVDTIYTPSNKIKRIETNVKIGTKYFINDPDGYGSIGDLDSDAKKNTASWE
jgi:hypothetical protein